MSIKREYWRVPEYRSCQDSRLKVVMNLFRGSPDNFCTICQENGPDEHYHTLSCGHQIHFSCCYQMVVHGRIYTCPNCRVHFTEHWVQNYEVFIYNEADRLNERQIWMTRLGQLRDIWRRAQSPMANMNDNNNNFGFRHQPLNTPPGTPPPLIQQNEADFMIDQDGNWVLPIGDDLDLEDILSQEQIQPDLAEVQPVRVQYDGPSLIPDRRAAQRRRRQQQQLQRQQQGQQQPYDTVEADDERESTSSSSQ